MFIYFYGLSGLGKSTFIEMTKTKCKNRTGDTGDIFCQSVSSDSCHKKLVDVYEKKHPNKTRNDHMEDCKAE